MSRSSPRLSTLAGIHQVRSREPGGPADRPPAVGGMGKSGGIAVRQGQRGRAHDAASEPSTIKVGVDRDVRVRGVRDVAQLQRGPSKAGATRRGRRVRRHASRSCGDARDDGSCDSLDVLELKLVRLERGAWIGVKSFGCFGSPLVSLVDLQDFRAGESSGSGTVQRSTSADLSVAVRR